ncbi:anchored repeat ABC transporter, substrate-binding protein, partial [Micromonospora sp. NPDC057140]
LTLRSVEGPGTFTAYALSGLGAASPLLGSGPGGKRSVRLPVGTRTGGVVWAFDAGGEYRLTLTGSAALRSGREVSADATYRVRVPVIDPVGQPPPVAPEPAARRDGPPVAAPAPVTAPKPAAAPGPTAASPSAVKAAATSTAARQVIADGHVDMGPQLSGDSWTIRIKDDRSSPPVWRETADVVLQIKDKAKTTVPAGTGFLGDPGDTVWLLPQTQQAGLVWPGWNTQHPSVVSGVRGDVTWTLRGVDGPGRFALFLTGAFGNADVLFDSSRPFPQKTGVALNSHAHGNWAFSKPGLYRLAVQMSGTTSAGRAVTDTKTLTIAVGDNTDPTDGFGPGGGADDGGDGDGGVLPRTGAGWVLTAGAAGVILVAVGTLLALVARRRRPSPRLWLLLPLLLIASLTYGCRSGATLRAHDERVQVVTTTGILRDLVGNVGGDRVLVTSLVPDGADPHSYEPSLRDVRDVVYADVAFSNYLLLEEQAVIKALDANLRDGVPNVSLAEGAVKYAAEIIPLVEDVSLDTIWLGMRVRGTGAALGANRASDVLLSATAADGPGRLLAYLTGSFGNPSFSVDSADGFEAANGYRDDTARLPPDAHTHMSWAFTRPGVYRLTMRARLAVTPDTAPVPLGEQVFTFAVGVDPHSVPGMTGATVLHSGHADVTADLDERRLYLFADPKGGGEANQRVHDPASTVIEVPNKALREVPGDRRFRFLGRPGTQVHQLPQAVLGKHVHGEIDPHLWQNVRNAISYVELIRDTLIGVDPAGATTYRANAAAYIRELEKLDSHVRDTIARIPPSRRHLVSTHDAFGYLAQAYGMNVSGFVTPNPATEPSLADRRRLTETIRNLKIPAVFLEPNLAARSTTLTEVAREEGLRVCPIYGDTFDRDVTTYAEMMRFNAESLRNCLTTDK